MTSKTLLLSAAVALAALPVTGQSAERPKAQVDCKAASEKLVYDCMIMLMGKKSEQPIEGAKVVVSADMPSMPMAHNIKPVTAMPMGKPGMYHARVQLEMHGEWALTMDVSGPLRDKLVHIMQFGTHAGEQAGMKHEPGEGMKDEHGEGMKMKE